MVRTIFASTALSALFLFIQTTWLRNGLFWGVIPDFSLLVILWVSYHNKDNQGPITGFFAGIICDILSSSPIGLFSFLYIVPAYLVMSLRQLLMMDRFFIPVLIGFGGTILKSLASLFLVLLFGSERINAYSFTDVHFWVEAAVNGALAPLVFLGLARLRPLLVTRKATE